MCNDGFGQRFKKEIRTADQLSRQILTELKATRFCEGANGVVILPWDGDPMIANWSVNNFDSGASLAIDVEWRCSISCRLYSRDTPWLNDVRAAP